MEIWLRPLAWTAAIIAAAYFIGHLINLMVGARLARLAAKTQGNWDDILISELKKRIPFWSLLVGIYVSLGHWPLTAESHEVARKMLAALGVASVSFALAGVTTRWIAAYGTRSAGAIPVSGLTQNLVRFVILILGALAIARGFGLDISGYLTALGVGGLAVALALQDPLSNLFAGILISVTGQVRIGDYIRFETTEGYVVDFNWRATRLRQLGDNIVVVPNAKLAQAIVINYSLPAPEMGIGVEMTVDMLSDLDKVERVTLDVARSVLRDVHGAVSSAEPTVRFMSITETGVRLSVGLRVRHFVDQILVRHEFLKRLRARYGEEGILHPVMTFPAPASATGTTSPAGTAGTAGTARA